MLIDSSNIVNKEIKNILSGNKQHLFNNKPDVCDDRV